MRNGEKNKFYNPIRQNRTHIKALAEYLNLPESAFVSYIVFSERCELKKVPANTESVVIVKRPAMLKRIRAALKKAPILYSEEEIHKMQDKLVILCNKSEVEKQQHIEDIKNKCPFCGSELVLRKGKHGAFYGCKAYPKCKFTRPIK